MEPNPARVVIVVAGQVVAPYKGDCAYYSVPAGAERSVNAVWTYEAI
jgi:uncharacterized protein (DUF427 family)